MSVLLGSALGIGARVLEGFARRRRNQAQRQDQYLDSQLVKEFQRRQAQQQQQTQALEEEFNQRLLSEYQRRQAAVVPEEPTPEPIRISSQAGDVLQRIWQMSRGDPDLFTNWASQYPSAEIQALVSDPSSWQRVLDQFMQIQTDPAMVSPEGIPETPISSSNVKGFSYDRNTGDLIVQFHNEGIYRYSGVPPNIFEGFANGVFPAKTKGKNEFGAWWPGKNPSVGGSHWELIRDIFPFERLD